MQKQEGSKPNTSIDVAETFVFELAGIVINVVGGEGTEGFSCCEASAHQKLTHSVCEADG